MRVFGLKFKALKAQKVSSFLKLRRFSSKPDAPRLLSTKPTAGLRASGSGSEVLPALPGPAFRV